MLTVLEMPPETEGSITLTYLVGIASRRGRLGLLCAVLVAVLGTASAQGASPNSMDALGDSITRAFNTCNPAGDCLYDSWATGENPAVDSYYQRLLALNSSIIGHNYNDAKSGAVMHELKEQANLAVVRKAELVGILMGSNDACTTSLLTMTKVAEYKSQFEEAMNLLATGGPLNLQIVVSSLPNVYRLWELFHTNGAALSDWNSYKICQSMLANPTSLSILDVERRQKVKTREEEFNSTLESVCAKYSQCRYDGGAGFMAAFNTGDVSTLDYFHPSVEGQEHLAQGAWEAFNAEYQFYGDSPFALEATSTTPQVFQLGSSDSLECGKFTLRYSPPSKSATNAALAISKYGECIFNHPFVSEGATLSSSNCEWLEKSFGLRSFLPGLFKNGNANLNCTLSFTTTGCHVNILQQSSLSEFQWLNVNSTYGSYKSQLSFNLAHMPYEVTGLGCATTGTNGEYHGSIPLQGMIIK